MSDYFSTATALQAHEANILRNLRSHLAEELRREADAYDLRALDMDDTHAQEQEWIAFGLRIAAAKVDVPRPLEEYRAVELA